MKIIISVFLSVKLIERSIVCNSGIKSALDSVYKCSKLKTVGVRYAHISLSLQSPSFKI